MDQLVRLQRVGLREASVANVAFVRLLTGVDAQMSFQLERVRRGVRAMRTLIWPLARVTPEVSLQFA